MNVKDKRARADANKAKSAHNEFDKSLRSAEQIDDPWKRARMLADVARVDAPDDSFLRTVKKAFKAAQEMGDPYRRVAASIPSIYALTEREKIEFAQEAILDLLEAANTIGHPVSKLHALESLWFCTFPLANATIEKIAQAALLSACQNASSWRAGRIMEYMALMLAAEDEQKAQELIHTMRDSRYKRRAQKMLNTQIAETVRKPKSFHE